MFSDSLESQDARILRSIKEQIREDHCSSSYLIGYNDGFHGYGPFDQTNPPHAYYLQGYLDGEGDRKSKSAREGIIYQESC